jgi:hypothetical protein
VVCAEVCHAKCRELCGCNPAILQNVTANYIKATDSTQASLSLSVLDVMEGDAYQSAALSGTIQELGVMPVNRTEAGIPVYQTVMRN